MQWSESIGSESSRKWKHWSEAPQQPTLHNRPKLLQKVKSFTINTKANNQLTDVNSISSMNTDHSWAHQQLTHMAAWAAKTYLVAVSLQPSSQWQVANSLPGGGPSADLRRYWSADLRRYRSAESRFDLAATVTWFTERPIETDSAVSAWTPGQFWNRLYLWSLCSMFKCFSPSDADQFCTYVRTLLQYFHVLPQKSTSEALLLSITLLLHFLITYFVRSV